MHRRPHFHPAGLLLLLIIVVSLAIGPALNAAEPIVQLPNVSELPTPPQRIPIFFPPEPPAPGAAIDDIGPLQSTGWDAPPELGEFVGEPFYPLLGSQLAERMLSRKLRENLEQFATQRKALRDKVRAVIHAAPDMSAEPLDENAFQALELSATELRRKLYDEDLDWGKYRTWGTAAERSTTAADVQRAREYQVLRAAVYYQDGLSPAQRRLLLELTTSLAHLPRKAEDIAPPRIAPGSTIFFLPETAQIQLPDPLPKSLADEFEKFLSAKNGLQRELAQAIIAADNQSLGARRRVLSELAKRQQSHIDALEAKAEELRCTIAALPSRPDSPPLPAEILAMEQTFSRARNALRAKLAERLRAVRREQSQYEPGCETLTYRADFQSGAFVPVSRAGGPLTATIVETHPQQMRNRTVEELLTKVSESFAKDTAPQRKEIEAQKRQLVLATVRALFPDAAKSTKFTAEQFAQAGRRLQEEEGRDHAAAYVDYSAAALRPGLSPAQRRILFQAALVELNLPLPAGVRRPVYIYTNP